ncbi:MAG: GGDEF domain-containing protein [Actinomycetota bacterium]|nr:GGDEF domain-containing protein [Actinomycetota bacterium]
MTPRQKSKASVDASELIRELAETQRQLRAVLDQLPAMIAYWDQDLCNVLANEAHGEWLGFTPEQMRGLHIREVIGPDLYLASKPHMDAALRGERQHFDRTIVDTQGITRHSQVAYVPDVETNGDVRGFFVLVTDVTERVFAEKELAAANAELERLSLRDSLTGLANGRAFHATLEQALSVLDGVKPGQRLVGLLAIDLDNFKPINDNYGHLAGDQVLVELARRLEDEVRAPDVVARLGGDEIVVLAVDLQNRGDAEALAQRLVHRLAQPVLLDTGVDVQVTASIGIAVAGENAIVPSATELIREADMRMYVAKNLGGNCVN